MFEVFFNKIYLIFRLIFFLFENCIENIGMIELFNLMYVFYIK